MGPNTFESAQEEPAAKISPENEPRLSQKASFLRSVLSGAVLSWAALSQIQTSDARAGEWEPPENIETKESGEKAVEREFRAAFPQTSAWLNPLLDRCERRPEGYRPLNQKIPIDFIGFEKLAGKIDIKALEARLGELLPPSFLAHITIRFEDKEAAKPKAYGEKIVKSESKAYGVTDTLKREITLFHAIAEDYRMETLVSCLLHELGHANGPLGNEWLSSAERKELFLEIRKRIADPGHYRTWYIDTMIASRQEEIERLEKEIAVLPQRDPRWGKLKTDLDAQTESIHLPDEFLAEVVSAAARKDPALPEADRRLVERLIAKTSMNFSNRAEERKKSEGEGKEPNYLKYLQKKGMIK